MFRHKTVLQSYLVTKSLTKNYHHFFHQNNFLFYFYFFQYYKPSGIPVRQLDSNMCALCGNQFLVQVGQEGVVENTYRLSCGHE